VNIDKIKEFMTIADEKIGIILAKRLFCVLLLLFEIDRKIIVEKLGVSRLTMKKYSTLIESGNIQAIFADTVYRRRSDMEDFREEIMAEMDKRPARTLREAAAVIEEVCGLKRSLPQVMKFKKNGFKPLKVGFLPAKADSAKQKAFVEEKLKPLIKLAKEGVVELFFGDASHFVMGGFAGTLWSRVRCFVKTACGRSRYNVQGALNFCGKKVTTVTSDTYISAEQVVALMKKLLAEHKDKALALVLDNAAYQRCGKVTEYAKEHGIGLIFLPPYSPNLNLIERFWKLVKSRVLNAAYHGTFEEF
jgi:transposase